ncbi:MAG: AI-2E family transporter, partial [Candidatus Marinimicrobia bacterium]|nr:AI-2E family transporter [Candidatus Neomarinimicrobiota bacterium]
LWILGIAFVLLYLVFILMDFDKLRNKWKSMLPPVYRDDVVNFASEFNGALHRYFRAQAAIASIVGILFAIGFEVIGLPMGVLLGLIIGLLNLVPYLQLLGLIPSFLLAIIQAIQTGGSIWGMIGLTTLIFVIVQTIQETILIPFIQRKNTGLSPAIVLLSLTIWAKVLGFLGLILAIPLTYLIHIYYMRYISKVSDIDYNPEIREINEVPELPPKPKRKPITQIIKDKLPGSSKKE